MSYPITGAALFESGKRFSVTMFEYSWLVQRTGRQAEYADWDKVLDEVVERGYDCIRIDAFPHVIAADNDGNYLEQVTFLPIPTAFMWGNHENVTVDAKAGLIEFMRKAKDRGIYIGLSSWYNDDTDNRKMMLSQPEDFTRIWIEVLDILAAENLLDGVVWVDLCNEFPLKHWTPNVYQTITGELPEVPMAESFAGLTDDWEDDTIENLNKFLVGSIEGVRAKYPNLKYCFSNQAYGEENFLAGDHSQFDLFEPHIWASDDMCLAQEINFFEALGGPFPEEVTTMYRKAEAKLKEDPSAYFDILDERTNVWAEAAKEKGVKLITTEAWTTVVYEDLSQCGFLGEWDWFKEVAEMGIKLAVAKGWTGICTSNFAEPHFEGMWHDVEWHKRMNDMIRNG